jgi:hypothetical protein
VALPLIQEAAVGIGTVSVKFGRTIKISSIKNENIIVQTTAATPTVLNAPFKTIETLSDYNQISRTLKLFWKTQLSPATEYVIRFVNFVDAANERIFEEQIVFTTLASGATPSEPGPRVPFNSVNEPKLEDILIEDKSIKINAFTGHQIIAKNPDFYITETDPESGAFYLENNYSNGRIKVRFNQRPAANFLNNKYFVAQKKKIQRQPGRWETISTRVVTHSWKPEVYVDFPSLNEATPSYFTENKKYFQKGYKYRIKVSKDVGI